MPTKEGRMPVAETTAAAPHREPKRSRRRTCWRRATVCAMAAAAGSLMLPPAVQALSSGCTLLNDPAFDAAYFQGVPGSQAFDAGEQITITAAPSTQTPAATGARLSVNSTVVDTAATLPDTLTYTIPTSGTYTVNWISVPGASWVNWTVTCTQPATAVALRGFTATRAATQVVIRWRTASELDLLGFNVYREVNGTRTRLNRRLIAGKGAGVYSFVDRRAPKGKTVRFWVQVVNLDGSRSWYGPARVFRA